MIRKSSYQIVFPFSFFIYTNHEQNDDRSKAVEPNQVDNWNPSKHKVEG